MLSRGLRAGVVRRTGLVVLTAAVLFGAAQLVLAPSSVDAQTAPEAASQRTVAATGFAQVAGTTGASSGGALMMSFEERSKGTDVQAAVKTVQDRIAKMTAALVAAGIPQSAIHTPGFNVGPNYGYPIAVPAIEPPMAVEPAKPGSAPGASTGAAPSAGPVAPDAGGMGVGVPGSGVAPTIYPPRPVPPSTPTGYIVNAQLSVDTAGPEQLAAGMRVAIENGATNVNSYSKGPGNPTPPDAAALAPAIRQATAQAKAMAQASAEAAGVTLGDLASVVVGAPSPSYGGPAPVVAWQVQVRVTYAIK